MSVRIITDSTVDLPESYKKQALIVPLTIHFGEEEYLDGIEPQNLHGILR